MAVEVGISKSVYYYFLFFYLKSVSNLSISFYWVFAFLQVVGMCFIKFSLLTISIRQNVTNSLYFISALFIVKLQLLFDLYCLFTIIVLNLLQFTIMLFSLNRLIGTSLSFSDNFHKSFKCFLAAYSVLSSAKFASYALFIKKINNKSLINMLNHTVHIMNTCSTPDKKILKRPLIPLIFIFCFLLSKCQ